MFVGRFPGGDPRVVILNEVKDLAQAQEPPFAARETSYSQARWFAALTMTSGGCVRKAIGRPLATIAATYAGPKTCLRT